MNHPLHDYSQRSNLHHEVHARPPIALWPEERVCSQAFLMSGQQERETQIRWIDQVLACYPEASRLASSPGYKLIQIAEPPARLLLRWELHGEFSTLCLFHQTGTKDDSHDWSTSRHLLLEDFQTLLSNLGHPLPQNAFQNRIAASDLIIRPGPRVDDAATLSPLFSGNTLIGSTILGSLNAQVWTDLQLDSNGFVRLLVQHQGMGSRQAGRVAQRLIDIDTYRMMSM
ncbi:MAG: DUF3422 family protein, partial [Burkholderiaceae bacterium]